MKLAIHAVGRAQDILPYLTLGAELHEVDSASSAAEAVREAARGSVSLVIVSEEFADAADAAPGALTFVAPGIGGGGDAAVEKTRELVSRSVGVDLIAKADRTGR
jgi:vacuolar-type H+-ATPase subunit F/Vma7